MDVLHLSWLIKLSKLNRSYSSTCHLSSTKRFFLNTKFVKALRVDTWFPGAFPGSFYHSGSSYYRNPTVLVKDIAQYSPRTREEDYYYYGYSSFMNKLIDLKYNPSDLRWKNILIQNDLAQSLNWK